VTIVKLILDITLMIWFGTIHQYCTITNYVDYNFEQSSILSESHILPVSLSDCIFVIIPVHRCSCLYRWLLRWAKNSIRKTNCKWNYN